MREAIPTPAGNTITIDLDQARLCELIKAEILGLVKQAWSEVASKVKPDAPATIRRKRSNVPLRDKGDLERSFRVSIEGNDIVVTCLGRYVYLIHERNLIRKREFSAAVRRAFACYAKEAAA